MIQNIMTTEQNDFMDMFKLINNFPANEVPPTQMKEDVLIFQNEQEDPTQYQTPPVPSILNNFIVCNICIRTENIFRMKN
jgi:hypothetical protein